MTEVVHSKKSSRLHAKKEQKPEIFIDKDWSAQNIQLSMLNEERLEEQPKVVKNFKVYKNQQGEIVGSYLAEALRGAHLVREQSTLSFYDFERQIYVYGFTIMPEKKIEKNINSKLLKDNTLYIKVRNKKKLVVDALIDEQREKYEETEEDKNNKQKEKKIGEVVEKVALWRKFYTGFYDQMGNYIQKPLENAANEVGIAKKTLDDYLLQIRNGKKYGFNFNEKVNAKIGELRAFVRDEKKKQTGK